MVYQVVEDKAFGGFWVCDDEGDSVPAPGNQTGDAWFADRESAQAFADLLTSTFPG